MKLALILLTIALMAQIAMAGVLGRSERDAADIPSVETSWKMIKLVAENSGPIVTKVLEKIPKTQAYAKYREELEDFLKHYNEYKSKKGPCFTKSSELNFQFQAFMDKWSKADAPAAAKEVYKFLSESVPEVLGDEDKKEMALMQEELKNPKKIDEDDKTIQTIAIMLEIC